VEEEEEKIKMLMKN